MNPMVFYSIVQFVPVPERHEAVNVGVVILDERKGRVYSKVVGERRKLRHYPDEQFNWTFFSAALSEFIDRVDYEMKRSNWKESLDRFITTRANNFRVTRPLPILTTEIEGELESLFSDLVAEQKSYEPRNRVRSKLRQRLNEVGIASLLDSKPPSVEIERYGVVLKPEFGYRNGHYNLIDASLFRAGKDGVAEIGRRAIEGRSLANDTDYRLIILGEFPVGDADFFLAAKHDLAQHDVQLFDLSDLQVFVDGVRSHA